MSTAGPRWRPTAIGMLVALLVLWALGLDLLHAVVLAATTLALMALRRSPAVNDGQEWPVEEGTRSDTGARREVSRLSWAMQGYESRVQRNSVARLHQIAAYRLGERGLDLEDPRTISAASLPSAPGPTGWSASRTTGPSTPTSWPR